AMPRTSRTTLTYSSSVSLHTRAGANDALCTQGGPPPGGIEDPPVPPPSGGMVPEPPVPVEPPAPVPVPVVVPLPVPVAVPVPVLGPAPPEPVPEPTAVPGSRSRGRAFVVSPISPEQAAMKAIATAPPRADRHCRDRGRRTEASV